MRRGDPIDVLVVPDWIGEPRAVLALIGTVAWIEPCPYADRPDHIAEAELLPGEESALLTTWWLYCDAACESGGVSSLDFCVGEARVWIVPREEEVED